MNGKAGGIDIILRGHHLAAFKINFHQRRRGNFLEHPAVWIEEEMVLGSRHASGDVGKDEIIPAIERDEAIGCSEVDAYFPLILADLIADAEGDLRVSDAHGSLKCASDTAEVALIRCGTSIFCSATSR